MTYWLKTYYYEKTIDEPYLVTRDYELSQEAFEREITSGDYEEKNGKWILKRGYQKKFVIEPEEDERSWLNPHGTSRRHYTNTRWWMGDFE